MSKPHGLSSNRLKAGADNLLEWAKSSDNANDIKKNDSGASLWLWQNSKLSDQT